MLIKSPCIIDVSHWEVPDWEHLDARVRAVIMKASQGKFYVDPTFGSSWIGAHKLPRSAYHFFEPHDVSAQVENFLTACEDAGAIVAGRWVGEIEPVLDAEYQPPTFASRIFNLQQRPPVRTKALLDLQAPHKYLSAGRARVQAPAPESASISADQLAAQYKAWLDLVEAELGIKPIIYTSKWMWNNAGNPAWSKNYKLWVAQYPYTPDEQNAPAYLPDAWEHWWLWQYSDKAQLQGVGGYVDVNVFNGTEQEFDYIYGGGYNPPEPPKEEPMGISIGTVLAPALNVRNAPDGSIIGQGFLKASDLVQFDKKQDEWVHVIAARRAGKDLTLPGAECWASMGATGSLMRGEWLIEAHPAEDASIILNLSAAIVDGVAYAPEHPAIAFKKA